MNRDCLKLAHLNICSLIPKFNDFRDFLTNSNIELFCLTETWLNNSISNDSVHIDGYTLLRADRLTRGGGVALYLRSDFQYSLIQTSNVIEEMWISTRFKEKNFVIGVCYRPPHINAKYFVDALEESISTCLQISDNIYCLGDLNIDLLHVDHPSSEYLISMLEIFNMKQILKDPTRVANTGTSLIDLILTNDPESILTSSVGGLNISDHELIQCTIRCAVPKPEPFLYTFRDFKKFNEDKFQRHLENLPLQDIFFIPDVNSKVSYLNKHLLALFDQHVPIKTVKITKKKAPWLTDNVRLMMSLRDKAKITFKRTKLPQHWNYYKQMRNLTTHAISNEKRAYFNYIASNKNSRQLWRELKLLNISTKIKHKLPQIMEDPEAINNYFIDSIPKISADKAEILNYYSTNRLCESGFSFKPIDTEYLRNIVLNLKLCSAGHDGLTALFVKLCCPYLLPILVNIINSVILQGTFPSAWKKALVTPVPKVASPSAFSELRPISVLSVISKLMEKVMEMQLREHFDVHDILPPTQSGFRPGYSCSTALLTITDDIFQSSDEGNLTALALLDFSKAFDTIDHEILIEILRSSGANVDATNLLSSYLNDRSQQVRLKGVISTSRTVSTGVPQGSILGPLLFTVYTSHFHRFIKYSRIHMYADDTQMYYSFPFKDAQIAEQEFSNDLQSLAELSSKHALLLNPSKSVLLLFGKKQDCLLLRNSFNIKINDTSLSISDSAKNLGVILDPSLRFRQHTQKNLQKAYNALRLLFPHRHHLNTKVKKSLCDALVLSQFTYCSPVYSPCLDQDHMNRIQRAQNSCIRFIYGIPKFEHISHRYSELGWLKMHIRFKVHTLCLYHKILMFKTPPYLYRKISFRSDVHNLNIRFRGLITPPRHRTRLYERSFRYNIAFLYNDLPIEMKSLKLHKFKKEIKKYISQI